MDKMLIKINQLQQELEKLHNDKLNNDTQITKYNDKNSILKQEIDDLKQKKSKLNNDKLDKSLAHKRRKDDKRSLIISFILSYLVTSLIVVLTVLVGSGGSLTILKCLGSLFFVMSFITSIVIPIEFKSINKKYPIYDLGQLEKEILDVSNMLEHLKNKIKTNNEILNKLKILNVSLEKQINDLIDRINYIKNLRAEVIDEYCKDNKVLDQKINIIYEDKIKKKRK